ncbi:MAG: nuclear transport factor 2 family protein [Cyanobacteria bacterium P01_E01_bin.6]
MSHSSTTYISDYDAIIKALQPYLDGATSGRGNNMKPTFHQDATIYGYIGPDLIAGPIQLLYDFNDQNGPASYLHARFVSIDIIDTIATVRIELDNWTGYQFTDLITLLKMDGEWKAVNKIFHTHATP